MSINPNTSKRWSIKNDEIKIDVAEYGAELKKLESKKGVNYIWCSDPKYWSYCAPFLWPSVGTLKDKETYYEGKLYQVRQHGILRNQDFKMVDIKDDEITFENEYNEETLKEYPYKYKVVVNYKLDGKKLYTNVTIYNLNDKMMPFSFGGHPAFNCPIYEGEDFKDYRIVFEKEESFDSPHCSPKGLLDYSVIDARYRNLKELYLTKNMFFLDTIIDTNVKSQEVELLNKDNKGIRFTFKGFKTLALWTPFNDAPFICIEPWNGYNDLVDSDKDFVKKDGIIKLEAKGEYKATYVMEIIE